MTAPPPGQWTPPPPPGPPWIPSPAGPKGGGTAKWILGGLALLVVVVVAVVATLLVTREDTRTADGPMETAGPATTADVSDIASADDDGPVEIITEDPTCVAWTSVSGALVQEASKGWDRRDPSLAGTEWTSAQRLQHEEMAEAMRSAADETAPLAILTPHRVIRELYEQSIAYWNAYADSVPTYAPTDDHLAKVATATSNSLTWICSSIQFKTAAARAPFVVPAPAPHDIAAPEDPKDPTRFVVEPPAVCPEWATELEQYGVATAAWFNTDPSTPASQWTPEQQAIYAEMSSVMQANADKLQTLGIRSENSVFDDFAALAAQYRRAYVQSFATYVPEDTYLANAATELVVANNQACLAAE